MSKKIEDEFDRAMREWGEEEDRYIRSLWESTPQTRKDWDSDEWVRAIYWHKGLIYEDDCPISEFSPEEWKEIIVEGWGVEAQFCPCEKEVLALLTKEDFKSFGSNNMCMTLALDGDWLAHLFPLEDIEQEDFDNILVCDPDDYSDEEEFLELVGSRFPDNKIPDHLNYPHKGESRK